MLMHHEWIVKKDKKNFIVILFRFRLVNIYIKMTRKSEAIIGRH